ncbi:MAG TPA: TonB family protein [Blastocatellia bacterium]|nr:TonB family protein [Blastocatellia bacterium]
MFDKLIDSTPARPKRRLLRYFFGTSLLYLLALTAALVVSVVAANPEMVHPSDLNLTHLVLPAKLGRPDKPRTDPHPPAKSPQPDIYNPVPLDQPPPEQAADTTPVQSNNPPRGPLIEGPGDPHGTPHGDPHSPGFIPGDGGEGRNAPPEPPEPPPPPVTASKPKPDAQSILKVPSTVLQGKATDRRTPVYPRMAVIGRIEGSVTVEVVISPEGRVEAARAVSGHPLLKPAAAEAARLWRFQPTLLNNSPVRVTGIITFVFKLN